MRRKYDRTLVIQTAMMKRFVLPSLSVEPMSEVARMKKMKNAQKGRLFGCIVLASQRAKMEILDNMIGDYYVRTLRFSWQF
jgi:hypothetical protein